VRAEIGGSFEDYGIVALQSSPEPSSLMLLAIAARAGLAHPSPVDPDFRAAGCEESWFHYSTVPNTSECAQT